MNNLIITSPMTRINDAFITSRNLVKLHGINETVTHPLITESVSSGTHYMADFYDRIAIDIVTETVLDYPYPYVTEKTLRPIACKRMFIILGAMNTLSLLKSHGFMTFDDMINEEYDNIADPELRLLAVVNEVKRFCDRDLADVKDYYRRNSEKFEHNANVLKNLRTSEIARISDLIDRKI